MKEIKESKMKRKKAGIFAAAAAALVIIALVISCMEPIDPSGLLGGFGNYPPPSAGKTYINLNINEAAARTIYPAAPGGSITYDLIFTDTSGGGTNDYTESGWTTGPVEVGAVTTFSLTVNAKSGGVVFARTATPITFTTGAAGSPAQNVNVTGLTRIINEGNGFLKWNFNSATTITLPTDSAVFTFTKTSGSGNGSGTVLTTHSITATETLDNTSSTGLAIESGLYTVTLTITKSGYKNSIISEELHIFEGHTSTWTFSIPAMIPVTNYSVTFDDNDGIYDGTLSGYDKTITTHGAMLDAADEPLDGWTATPNNDSFLGWSTHQGSGGKLWVFDDTNGTRILSSITLYAKFQTTQTELTINLTPYSLPGEIDLPVDLLTNATAISIEDDIYQGGATDAVRSVTVDLTGLTVTGNLIWKYNGAALAAGNAISFSGASDSVLEIDFSQGQAATLGLNAKGTHIFTVSATVGTNTWAAVFSITVNP